MVDVSVLFSLIGIIALGALASFFFSLAFQIARIDSNVWERNRQSLKRCHAYARTGSMEALYTDSAVKKGCVDPHGGLVVNRKNHTFETQPVLSSSAIQNVIL